MTSRRKVSLSRSKRHPPDADSSITKRPRFSMNEKGDGGGPADCSDEGFDSRRLGKQQWIEPTEYLRLVTQSLYELGYSQIAELLEEQSKVKHEEANVVELRRAVLNGDWNKALDLLHTIPLEDELSKKAQFLFIEEKYLEAAEKRDWKTALNLLRSELAPLDVNVSRLHLLASCLICPTLEELKRIAQWEGSTEASREKVLSTLYDIIPPNVLLRPGRLVSLLEQAIQSQIDRCLHHNTANVVPSLLEDYSASLDQIPTEVIHELHGHKDEVWHVEFSHDGKYLASCSKDCCAIIWEVTRFKFWKVKNGGIQVRKRDEVVKKMELVGHSKTVIFLLWSPNDAYLATISEDRTLKIWKTQNGECVRTISGLATFSTSMGWMPDSQHFISGSMDTHLCLWNLEDQQLNTWELSLVRDMVVSPIGDRLMIAGNDSKIKIFNLEDWRNPKMDLLSEPVGTIETSISITSISVSRNGRDLLACTKKRQIQLWELNPDLSRPQPTKPKKTYKLPPLETEYEYVIRACFGGQNDAFVLSGSEECKIYMWHKNSGRLVVQLDGHSGLVNSVSWNPVDPSMFASASDDNSVQIWGAKKPSSRQW